MYESLNLRKIL